jgi:hypothetical protein
LLHGGIPSLIDSLLLHFSLYRSNRSFPSVSIVILRNGK